VNVVLSRSNRALASPHSTSACFRRASSKAPMTSKHAARCAAYAGATAAFVLVNGMDISPPGAQRDASGHRVRRGLGPGLAAVVRGEDVVDEVHRGRPAVFPL
jgi:hypothetical protein